MTGEIQTKDESQPGKKALNYLLWGEANQELRLDRLSET